MTVQQLIEILQTKDPKLRVFVPGYEDGLNDISTELVIIDVELDKNIEWYYGQHDQITKPTDTSIKGLLLWGKNKF